MYLNMELAVFNYHSMERFAAAVMTTVDLCNDTTAGARQITFLHSKSRKKVEITLYRAISIFYSWATTVVSKY